MSVNIKTGNTSHHLPQMFRFVFLPNNEMRRRISLSESVWSKETMRTKYAAEDFLSLVDKKYEVSSFLRTLHYEIVCVQTHTQTYIHRDNAHTNAQKVLNYYFKLLKERVISYFIVKFFILYHRRTLKCLAWVLCKKTSPGGSSRAKWDRVRAKPTANLLL